MKQAEVIMGMPIEIDIVDEVTAGDFKAVFDYFRYVDEKFSTYKKDSEISKINRGEIEESAYSEDMKTIFQLSEQTKKNTLGFFDIRKKDGQIDPSGVVKGWAIHQAAQLMREAGFKNFFIEAGGDIEVSGRSETDELWKIGIRHPFDKKKIAKVIYLEKGGVATSGTYERGLHIYNPHTGETVKEIVALTVIGPDVFEADRYATGAFAMGKKGIYFIEQITGLEGYMIDASGRAVLTSGFENYTEKTTVSF